MPLKSCNTSCRKNRKLRKTVVALLLSAPKTIQWSTLASAKIDALWNSLSFFQFCIKLEILNGKIGQANGSCKKEDGQLFFMKPWPPYWQTKTKKRQPSWWNKTSLGEMNEIFMKIIPFVSAGHVSENHLYNLFDLCTEPHKIIRPFYQPFQVTLSLIAFILVLLYIHLPQFLSPMECFYFFLVICFYPTQKKHSISSKCWMLKIDVLMKRSVYVT